MRRLISGLVIVLAFSVIGASSVEAFVDPDVAGIWLFDEDEGEVATDSSGNGNDGVIMGGVQWTADGKFGGALEFDGVDGWVEVEDDDSVEFPSGVDFTLACWLKVTTPEDSPPMIVAKNYQPAEVRPWYALYYADQSKTATGNVSFFLRDDAGTNFHIASSTNIDDGEWHHVAGTREKGTMRLYVDGIEEASMDGADFDVGTSDAPLHFMSHLNRFMGGFLDEVLIVRRALSADEVGSLMNSGIDMMLEVSSLGKLPTTWARIKEQ
jgi:hypothetical protein